MDKIYRSWDFNPQTTATFRAADSDEDATEEVFAGEFTGHASVFNQPTLIGSRDFGFMEVVAPNAFADVLDQDVRLLFNHEGAPLARTTNGTLELSQDKVGLLNHGKIINTQQGVDLVKGLRSGLLDQMSFGFVIGEGNSQWSTYESDDELNGMDIRTINRVSQLFDTSIVTYGAYPTTDAGLRSNAVSEDEIAETLKVVHSENDVLRELQELNEARFEFLAKLARTPQEIRTLYKEKM